MTDHPTVSETQDECPSCHHQPHPGVVCPALVDSAWTRSNTRPCGCSKTFIGVMNGQPQFRESETQDEENYMDGAKQEVSDMQVFEQWWANPEHRFAINGDEVAGKSLAAGVWCAARRKQ